MLRRMIALILALALPAFAAPAALAQGTYSAHTPLSGADGDKLNNLRLAAQAIDGSAVAHGDSFSFNRTVGPREKRRGYRKALNGRGALVTGGGVAQAASTLYMALLKMGDYVEIDPVKTYGNRFSDDYVQNPSLAIVTDYDAGIDLSFTNLGDDMIIDMWLDEDDLWCVVSSGQQGPMTFLNDDSDDVASAGDDGEAALERLEPGNGLGILDLYNSDAWHERKPRFDDDEDDDSFDQSSVPVNSLLNGDYERECLGSVCLDCGGDKNVLHNVALAADSLNDTVLEAGDLFSFNEVVGPRTKKYGYRRATNGRGAKVTGGGVAQVASALWLAIKDTGCFSIKEKSTYGSRYNQSYVDDAADAILTDYSSGKDFSFRYTGDASLTIYAWVEDGCLYCDVYED